MKDQQQPLPLEFRGTLPDQAVDLLAEMLLSDCGQDCELCGQRPAEHFVDTPWGQRHVCTPCLESLPHHKEPPLDPGDQHF